MPWNYTADKSRRVAVAQAGWKLDAKMGYVFTTPQSDTVPIWQHFSPTSKDAIYAKSVDTIALQSGYELSMTPAWHMYEHQKPGTVPLYRFCKDNFNFFGDDESIKLGKTEGWKNWAIVGYYYKEHQPGTSVLLRWDTEPYFQLLYNNTVLRASSYSEVDGYMKYSHLSLDYILQFRMGALEIVPAPDNLQEPDNEHMIPGVFSQQVVQTNKCDFRHKGGARFWALTDFVSPSTAREVDLEPHLRRLEDGHIVFLHPGRDTSMDWLHKILKFNADMAENQKEPEEKLVDMWLEKWAEYCNGKYLGPDVKAFMKNTYVDPHTGRLARRSVFVDQ